MRVSGVVTRKRKSKIPVGGCVGCIVRQQEPSVIYTNHNKENLWNFNLNIESAKCPFSKNKEEQLSNNLAAASKPVMVYSGGDPIKIEPSDSVLQITNKITISAKLFELEVRFEEEVNYARWLDTSNAKPLMMDEITDFILDFEEGSGAYAKNRSIASVETGLDFEAMEDYLLLTGSKCISFLNDVNL